MNTTRRDFLKKSGLIISAFPILGLVKLLPMPEAVGYPVPVGEIDIIKLITAELSMYPKGHVAHSLYRVKKVMSERSFNTIIRGLSTSLDRKKVKYFVFELRLVTKSLTPAELIDEEVVFKENAKYRRDFIDEILQRMERVWKSEGIQWGIAPDETHFEPVVFNCSGDIQIDDYDKGKTKLQYPPGNFE